MGVPGNLDNTSGLSARFNNPAGLASDGTTLYVADSANGSIRKVTIATSAVTTFVAGFNAPAGVAVDGLGNTYVADTGNHVIKKLNSVGSVTLLSGISGTPGALNSTLALSTFTSPQGVAVNSSGTFIYVADTGNNLVRLIDTTSGFVTTIASGFKPVGLALNAAGTVLYATDYNGHTIRSITLAGNVLATVAGSIGVPGGSDFPALFRNPTGVTIDSAGDLYVADNGNHTIRKISGSTVTTVAGAALSIGNTDGAGTSARFNGPFGIVATGVATVFIADGNNYTIRRAAPSTAPTITSANNTSFAVGVAGTFTVTASGSPASTFSVVSGSLPSGVLLNSTTGVISGTASVSGIYPVTLQAANGILPNATQSFTLTVSQGTAITSANSATFAVSALGTFTVTASATPAVTSFVPSGNFPFWASLTTNLGANTATLSGTPPNTTGSPFSFTITASNGVGAPAVQNFTLTVSSGVAVSTPPQNVTASIGQNVQFSVNASGTPSPTFQWQRQPAAGGGFTNLTESFPYSGTTSPTLTVSSVGTIMNGDQFQVIVSNGVGSPITSGPATLTVATAPVITSQPSAIFAVGYSGSFTVTATGLPAPTFSYAGSFPPWASLNTSTGQITGFPSDQTGSPFFFTITANNNINPPATQNFTLTVNQVGPVPAFISNPTPYTAQAGQSATFSAQAVSTAAQTLRWQRSAVGSFAGFVDLNDDGTYFGTTSGTLTIGITTAAMNGDQFRLVAYNVNAPGGVPSNPATLTVNSTPPTIVSNPVSVTVNTGQSTSFSASATGIPTPNLRWQRQPSGTTTFVDLVDDAIFNGTTSTTLFVTSVSAGMNGDLFRLSATHAGGTAYSTTATLTVNFGTTITTFAGMAGVAGSIDGTGVAARFNGPASIAVDPAGTFYIADTANSVIRKMTPNGQVTTLAGLAGNGGNADGVGSTARFNAPAGIAVDLFGNVYVADTFNHTIRLITPGGVVTTLAGSPGSVGAVDGFGSSARFFLPTGVAIDSAGSIVVADSQNHAIRRVTNIGNVTTIAGTLGAPGFLDNAVGTLARFSLPNSLTRDSGGNIFVVDTQNHAIRKIAPGGAVSTIAGNIGGFPGSTDGIGGAAAFNRPSGIAVDGFGNLYVADTNNHTIRRISLTYEVTTVAGFPLVSGSTDGVGTAARFSRPFGVVIDPNGNLYVADTGNHTIRRSGSTTAVQITTQPANQTAGISQDATFTVVATGSPTPTSYQWQRQPAGSFGYVNLGASATYTGVNTTTLIVRGVTSVMNGDQFRVVVANGVNPPAVSDGAVLTAGILPVFTSVASASFRAQELGSFTITATSPTTVTYTATGLPSWATLNGTTGVLSGTPPDTSGSPFSITISANNGVIATQTFALTVLPANLPPVIATQPVGTSVNPGQSASFSVAVTGTAPFNYQWRRNGIPIAGATTTTLSLTGIQAASAGTYTAAVTNSFGSVVSAGANLVVNVAPSVTSQPSSQVAVTGGSASFSVVATGGSSYSYQWRKNGLAIAGANGATLNLSNLTAADAGNYDVVVTNSAGSTNSSIALLSVSSSPSAPIITTQPAGRGVLAGTPVTLSVSATGVPAPGYQWRKNGSPIAGANSATYGITSAQVGDTAGYDVVVTNAVGSVTSSSAVLRVFPRSYAGIYFGTFSNGLGNFALYVRDDHSGVFLGYLPGSTAPVMSLGVSISDNGQFTFTQGAIATTSSSADEPARAAALGAVTAVGTIATDGSISGSLLGGASASLSGNRSIDTGTTQGVAGYYQAGANNSGASAYTIVGSSGQALVVVQAGATSDGGSGNATTSGQVSVLTNRSIISETINAQAGTITGTSTGAVTASFAGGSDAAVARQRLVNISSRARVGTADAVAIAGFVISGVESKTVLIRAVGPTLGTVPFNVPGTLASPRLEIFQGSTSIATNSGIASSRAAIDAAGLQAGAFALGAAGTDAAILTSLAPGNYTAVVSSTTNAAGVALVEVYDLSGGTLGQKLLNISTRAAVGTDDNLLIAGFVIPPGTTKRVLIRGVGPGLTVFGVSGALARPALTLFSGATSVASNTNWTTSADAATITAASLQVGAFGLSNNDSAMIATLAPGNYTAQVIGVGGTTGIALLEVYELP